MKNKGFDDSFLKEYRSEIFTQENIDGFSAGDPAVMETIENYHDEWTYFNSGCTGDDDLIVAMTNEAWLPDKEGKTMKNNVQEALSRIVKCIRTTMRMAEAVNSELPENGNNLFDSLHGDLEDSLYHLCDEKTMDLQSSTVDRLIMDDSLSEDQVAEALSALVKIK